MRHRHRPPLRRRWKQATGHTSLTGAADAQIAIQRDTANNIVATVEGMKDGHEGDVIVSRLDPIDLGTDEDSETITSCVVVPVEGEPLPSTKKSRREPASLRTFRDAFTEALINGGKTTHVPAMAR